MLGFKRGDAGGGKAAPQAAGGHVIDGTEAQFMAQVVETSREVPVIVDFWAPWCGPCKALGPALEAAVNALKGRVRMVKINVDENPRIAQQLQIQSIPTVYAFWQGQPADGFQGALPGSEVKAFVERVAALAGDGGVGEALEAAEAMLKQGALAEAAQTFAAILREEPENPAAHGGMIRTYIAAGQLDQADTMLGAIPEKAAKSPEVEAARAQLQLARQAANAGPVEDLRTAVAADPDDHKARFDLAQALHARGDVADAVDELLELFRRDRDWNDGAAKTQLFTIFDALKPNDPIALKGRRRLSSMLFS